jgi:phosphatidylserine/phosphatidylglycerophosphate/cardiolipin synthase-like enzyme
MDTRSFLINFELSLLQYDRELTTRLVEEFDAMADRAAPVPLRAVTRQPFWQNLAEGTCRVLSPLL